MHVCSVALPLIGVLGRLDFKAATVLQERRKAMGTRADFYVGEGEAAEWIGSVAYDGYPDGIPDTVLCSTGVDGYRSRVADFIRSRNHGTTPDMGWPWPWEDSRTTDFAYAFCDGKVQASCFGGPWFDPTDERPGEPTAEGPAPTFPDMSSRANVARGARSGVLTLSLRGSS